MLSNEAVGAWRRIRTEWGFRARVGDVIRTLCLSTVMSFLRRREGRATRRAFSNAGLEVKALQRLECIMAGSVPPPCTPVGPSNPKGVEIPIRETPKIEREPMTPGFGRTRGAQLRRFDTPTIPANHPHLPQRLLMTLSNHPNSIVMLSGNLFVPRDGIDLTLAPCLA